MESSVSRNSPVLTSTGSARQWTVTASSSPGRWVALTHGRAAMWRARRGPEVERAAEEDPVDRADDRPARR